MRLGSIFYFPLAVVSCVAAAALRGTDDTADNLTALRVSGSYENLEYSPLGIEHGRAPAPVAQLTKDMSIKVCPPFLHVTLTHVRGKIFQIGIPDGILDPTGACTSEKLVKSREQFFENHGVSERMRSSNKINRDVHGEGFRFDSGVPEGLLRCAQDSAPQFERISIGSLQKAVMSLITEQLAKIGVPSSAITEALLPPSGAEEWMDIENKEAYRHARAMIAGLSKSYLLTLYRAQNANATPSADRVGEIAHRECLYVHGSLTVGEIKMHIDELVDALALLARSRELPIVNVPRRTYYAVGAECRVGVGAKAVIEKLSVEESSTASEGYGSFGSGVEIDVRVNERLQCAKTYMSNIFEAESMMQLSATGREALKTAENLVTSLQRETRLSGTAKAFEESSLAPYLPKIVQRVQIIQAKRKVLVAYVDLHKCSEFEYAKPVALLLVEQSVSRFVCRYRGKLVPCIDGMPMADMTEMNIRNAQSVGPVLRANVDEQKLVEESSILMTHSQKQDTCVFSSKSDYSEALESGLIGTLTTPEALPEVSSEPLNARFVQEDVMISRKPVSAIDLIAGPTVKVYSYYI